MSGDEADWRVRVAAVQRRGDHLATYDLAAEALADHPQSAFLHYAAILALARSGATRGAQARLDALHRSGILDGLTDPALALDFAALGGRLHKDAWARSDGATAHAHALRAGQAYAEAFTRFGQSYPAINAATMFLVAGEKGAARRYAVAALAETAREPSSYWAEATAAEASLILGDVDAVASAFERAAAFRPGIDDLATTRRQIRIVAGATGIDPGILDGLAVPAVGYWLDDGASRAAAGASRRAAAEAGIAFGALVEPVDLDRAAALLARGAELALVMPCEPPGWLAVRDPAVAVVVRPLLEDVLARASNVVFVTREGRPDDPAALDLCRRQVRGLARLRADHLATAPQRMIWRRGLAEGERLADPEPPGAVAPAPSEGRVARALVFGDVRGFSRLSEADQLVFLDRVIGGFAEVLADVPVDYVETAGDGIYLVLPDVEEAARCCVALRGVLDPERVAASGLPHHLGLRLSAHVGPVHRRRDRVLGRDKFCGAEVIRTARIEPVTPVGEIFVTEQFAAVMADSAGDRYACDYAGLQPMAKGYGACRMYALRRARD